MNPDCARLASVVDDVCVAAAITLPVVAVLRWNRVGVFVGAFTNWLSIVVAGLLINELDPKHGGGLSATLDLVWFLFGWIAGLFYSLLIFAVKSLAIFVWRKTMRQPESRKGEKNAEEA